MFIIDNEGKQIEITDLQKAIEQADDFRDYKFHLREMENFEKRQHEYWNDVYLKLLELNKTN